MPSYLSSNISAAVGGAAAIDIQPALGTAYKIVDFFADAVFSGLVPDVQVAIRDGILTDAVVMIDPGTAVQKVRAKELYITNANYLRMTNTAVGAQNLGWVGHQVPAGIVMTDIFTVPNAGNVVVQPPEGEVWLVTEVGAETMNATNWPDLEIYITDGVLVASMYADGARNLVWPKLLNLYISNDVYLRLEEIVNADNDIGLSMIRVAVEQFADVQDIGADANMDVQPADGQEAVVTGWSAETWAGVAAAGSPDIFVGLYNGAVVSDIAEDGTTSDSLINNRKFEIFIDNAVYMRITEGSSANNEIGYVGYTRRLYNP